MRRPILVCTLVFAVAASAVAYNWDEHEKLSHDGLRVAVETFDPAHTKLSAADREIIDRLIDGRGVPITYGITVALVDNLVDPLKVFEYHGKGRHYARSWRVTDVSAPVRLPSRLDELDAFLLSSTLRRWDVAGRAATNNDSHFQEELFVNLHHWHSSAIDVASGQHKLLAALLLNAIGDHFLQDAFAPGHLVTPRYGAHDAAALAIHDYYNLHGGEFSFSADERWLKEISPILATMRKLAPELGIRAECIDTLLIERGGGRVELTGDGTLDRSSRMRSLITAMTARSILDVLQSYGGERRDSFEQITWRPTLFSSTSLIGRSVTLPYGELEPYQTMPLVFAPTMALSAGTESLFMGEHRIRAIVDADFLVAGNPGQWPDDIGVARPAQNSIGWAAGGTLAADSREHVAGFRGRFIYAIPLIHTQFTLDGTYRRHSADGEAHWKGGWGVRAESGFSLLTFDFGLGRDHAFDAVGRLRGAWALRSGVSFAAPLTRIPLIGSAVRSFIGREIRPETCATASRP
jgi:hypothetical protein